MTPPSGIVKAKKHFQGLRKLTSGHIQAFTLHVPKFGLNVTSSVNCIQVKKNREKRLKEKETRLEQLRLKKDAQFKARHLLQKVTF